MPLEDTPEYSSSNGLHVSGDKQYTSQLDEASKARAKKELNERNDKDRDSAVRALQNWASGQNWLRTPMGKTRCNNTDTSYDNGI